MNKLEHKITMTNAGSDKIDLQLTRVIWVFYLIQTSNIVIKLALPISDYLWKLLSNIFMLIIAIFMIFSLKHIIKRRFKFFITAEFLFIALYILSFLMGNAAASDILNYGFWTLFVSIPVALHFISIDNKDIFYRESVKFSRIIIIIGSIGFLKMETEVYSMALAYSMLISLLVQTNELFTNPRFFSILFTVVPLSVIFLFGSRGPLLNISFFILIMIIKSREKRITLKRVFLNCTILILIAVVIIFYNEICSYADGILKQYGVYSRTLSKLIFNNINDSTGRNLLFEYYLNLAKEKPYIGWGLLGGWIPETGPHNTIIELWLAFGFSIGTILSILAVTAIFRPIWLKGKDANLYTIYAAGNLTMILVAGDFLNKYNFFILLFFYIDEVIRKSNVAESNTEPRKLDSKAGLILNNPADGANKRNYPFTANIPYNANKRGVNE